MRVVKFFAWAMFWLMTFTMALVIGTGVAGGIMYINEKLNQFGTIWLGG